MVTAATQKLIDQAVADALAAAQAGAVQAVSKPHLIDNLRKTWRKSAEQGASQLWRFLRLTATGSVVPIVDLLVKGTGHFDWETLLVIIVPIAEGSWRQLHPALTSGQVDSAPGVTIVPDQVADPSASSTVPTLVPSGDVTVIPAAPAAPAAPAPEGDAAP